MTIHTFGSTGTYRRGENKGMTTAINPRMLIFAHNTFPSDASLGTWLYVAKGHRSRYVYTANAASRTTMFDLIAAEFQFFESNDIMDRIAVYN